MTFSELNPFIIKSLTSFVNRYNSNSKETRGLDLVRGGKCRSEITAAYLFAATTLELPKNELIETARDLLSQRTDILLWPESAYAPTDENDAYWGTVPTSFSIIALAELLLKYPEPSLVAELIRSCDKLFEFEENGYFRKAAINRSDVHNTNLLAAYALFKAADLLPDGSVRGRMYRESSRRSILKILMHQSPTGLFPYHQLTLACPILYQAMVVAQLKIFLGEFSNGILQKSYFAGCNALRNFLDNDGTITWDRANNNDKKGALWAYSFAYCAFANTDNRIAERILKKLESHWKNGLFQGVDGDPREDVFYSSWILFGLIWSKQIKIKSETGSLLTTSKWWLLKFHYLFNQIVFFLKYIRNRYLNFLFESGALENRKWGG